MDNSIMQTLLGIGLEPRYLNYWQVALRGIIVFITGLTMVRVGAKRFLARKTAFDVILAFILASMLARAINGSAAFFPTILCGFVLVLFHRLIAAIAFHWHAFGTLVKGGDDLIIENGQVRPEALRRHYLSERDLMEDLRLKSCDDPAKVKCARLERSGDVSVIPREG